MKNESRYSFAPLFLSLGTTLVLMWAVWSQGTLMPGSVQASPTQAELRVCSACTYTTIQAAVDAADPGDVVKVATGVYTDVNAHGGLAQVVYISKTLTMQGGYTPVNWTTPDPVNNPTTLDAQGLGRVLYITGSINPTIEGLRLTGGDATGLGDRGGGVYVFIAAATISNCVVYSNTASTAASGWGGGLYLIGSDDAVLSGNVVQGNTASTVNSGNGGGLFLSGSDATLRGNTVQGNTASTGGVGTGGGLYLWASAATLDGNTVQGNTASTASYGFGGGLLLEDSAATLTSNMVLNNTSSTADWGAGGGVYLNGSAATLGGNTVRGNTASTGSTGTGGGVSLWQSPATLRGNTIVSNTATLDSLASGYGGGVRVRQSNPFTLTNNLVADNQANTQGSGLSFEGSAVNLAWGSLIHTTIADNAGSGQGVFVGNYTTLALTNTIVAGHPGVGIDVAAGGAVTLEATLWYDNGTHTSGGGTIISSTNVYGDPAFASPAAWDYHLTTASAAVDEGVNAGVTTDIDGDARPVGTGYDIGADEHRRVAVQLAPDHSSTTTPGTVVSYTHTLTNTGNVSDTFELTYSSSQGWGQVAPPALVLLTPGATQTVRVTVTVPLGAISGTVETTVITATSQAAPDASAVATDTTTVMVEQQLLYLPLVLRDFQPILDAHTPGDRRARRFDNCPLE